MRNSPFNVGIRRRRYGFTSMFVLVIVILVIWHCFSVMESFLQFWCGSFVMDNVIFDRYCDIAGDKNQ